MTWVVPAAFQAAVDTASQELVAVLRIHVPILGWLTVIDYTLGAGNTLTVDANNPHTLTEGSDFTAATSNAATAQAIANAWNSSLTRVLDAGAKAVYSGGSSVAFVALDPSVTAISISSNDVTAWDHILPDNPTTFDFCSHIGLHHPALGEFLPVIGEISGLEWEMDPITRQSSPPRADVTFVDDGAVSAIRRGADEIPGDFRHRILRRREADAPQRAARATRGSRGAVE